MKNYSPIKKLSIGVFLTVSFYVLEELIGGTDGLAHIQTGLKSSFYKYMSEGLSEALAALICLPLSIFMVYAFISGLYRICTFNIINPVFDNVPKGGVIVKGCDSYSEINRILSYRESKMASMSPERAAELYISSSKIDSLYTGYSNGPETQRALSFMESKLCGMSPERGLDYLCNKL